MRLAGNPWSESTLNSNGLGSLDGNTLEQPSIPSGDPILEYGQQAAAIVMSAIEKAPASEKNALKKVLDKVDVKLYPVYQRELGKAKGRGESQSRAMKQALTNAFQSGMANEFVRLGRTKSVASNSHVGLAKYHGSYDNYALAGERRELSGIGDWLSSALDSIGSAACSVANNSVTPYAAGAAGAYYGGPEGASLAVTGAGVAAAACAPDAPSGGGAPVILGGGGTPSWVLPAILGGGALALLLVLKK
jgi:hypothetical protein